MQPRRRASALGLTLGILLACLAAGATSAATPAPAFSVSLTDDGTCQLSAKASWSHTKASEVDVAWSFGIASWQDNLTSIKGRHAVDTFAAGVSSSTRTWTVIAYVYLNGVLIGQASDSVPLPCALLL
jgi:hypothetical protein